MRKIFVCSLLCLNTVFVFSYIPSINDKSIKELGYIIPSETEIITSVYNKGEIVDIIKDPTNESISVVMIKTSFNITFKGRNFLENIYVIYAGIADTNLYKNNQIYKGTVIGKQFQNDHLSSTIYFYTNRFSPTLHQYSKGNYLEKDGRYWWDANVILD